MSTEKANDPVERLAILLQRPVETIRLGLLTIRSCWGLTDTVTDRLAVVVLEVIITSPISFDALLGSAAGFAAQAIRDDGIDFETVIRDLGKLANRGIVGFTAVAALQLAHKRTVVTSAAPIDTVQATGETLESIAEFRCQVRVAVDAICNVIDVGSTIAPTFTLSRGIRTKMGPEGHACIEHEATSGRTLIVRVNGGSGDSETL